MADLHLRDPARHRRRAVQRPAAPDACGKTSSTTGFIARAHRGLRAELKRVVRDFTPRDVATTCGIARGRPRARRRAGSARRGAALSLYCQGLNQSSSGHGEERRADQPAPGDRPDRPARRRPVLADRPAERDGRSRGRRHGEPAVGASRPRRTPTHRAEVAALWGVDDVPATPRQDRGRAVRRARRRRRSRLLWIACTNPAQSMPDQASRARARSRRPSSSCCRRRSPTTATAPYADVLLPATTLGREGRHRHELRAPHQPRATRRCRRPARRATTGRIVVRLRAPRSTRAHRGRSARALFAYADAGVGVERASRDDARPRPRHHRPVVRDARRARPAAVAVPRRRDAKAASGSTKTACSRRRRAARASSPTPYKPPAEARRRALPVRRSTPAACATSGTA